MAHQAQAAPNADKGSDAFPDGCGLAPGAGRVSGAGTQTLTH